MKNKLTKKEKTMIANYERAYCSAVGYAYENPSIHKIRAELKIKEEMSERGGWGYRVTGWNSCTFSCAYLYEKDGKRYLRYHTHCNAYDIDLSKDE